MKGFDDLIDFDWSGKGNGTQSAVMPEIYQADLSPAPVMQPLIAPVPVYDYAPPPAAPVVVTASGETTHAAAPPETTAAPTMPAAAAAAVPTAAPGVVKIIKNGGNGDGQKVKVVQVKPANGATDAGDELLFGYPRNYVYIAGGVAVVAGLYMFSGKK